MEKDIITFINEADPVFVEVIPTQTNQFSYADLQKAWSYMIGRVYKTKEKDPELEYFLNKYKLLTELFLAQRKSQSDYMIAFYSHLEAPNILIQLYQQKTPDILSHTLIISSSSLQGIMAEMVSEQKEAIGIIVWSRN
jgi:hypothetical protein